ncbi:MAG: hydrogenase maturation protease [Candidatus Syntrophoarchaeum caldarius]|uniref:Hydrogenase maturation protease n=1 Tax=Candidatus Syntropharchaeum caldarium TaxID=1838285 RepID=A0A1F2P898_9EURY|nr:MAG: hydrogenase maturation protease [Candidatus Syntrophoarchaeum caldarius]
MKKVLILCCGNPLALDDGIGIYVLEELRKEELPDYVELVDAGTGGLSILNLIEDAEKIIIVDAVRTGGDIGTIHIIKGNDLPEPESVNFSLHDLGLVDVLRIGETIMPESMPDDITIVGIEVEKSDEFGIGLTPEVEKTIPEVVRRILDELSRLNSVQDLYYCDTYA